MPKPEKIEQVARFKEYMDSANAVLLSDYAGLTVEQMNKLRKSLREKEVKYLIAKNTLLKIAADSSGDGLEQLADYWNGPTAVAFTSGDPSVGAKALFEFAKSTRKLGKPVFKAGIVDGVFYDKDQLERLAKLPGRDELLARVVGVVTSPLSSLVGTLDGIIREFIMTVDAIAAEKN